MEFLVAFQVVQSEALKSFVNGCFLVRASKEATEVNSGAPLAMVPPIGYDNVKGLLEGSRKGSWWGVHL